VGGLFADFHSILNRRKNCSSKLLNVNGVIDVSHLEIHASEPLVSEPTSEVEIVVANLKKYKTPGNDQIPAELIQAGGGILSPKIHKLINSV
jgi:hypothetical protein